MSTTHTTQVDHKFINLEASIQFILAFCACAEALVSAPTLRRLGYQQNGNAH